MTSALVCASDVALRRISNVLGFVIFCCSVLLSFESKQNVSMHVLSAICVILIMLLAYVLKMIGGGDVKLMIAFSLAIPIHYLDDALFNIAIVGGVLAIFYLMKYRVLKLVPQGGELGLPYGIAISFGFYITIYNFYI
ncbi:prepilin peptidase [Vibrio sp. 10N.261.51.F12]|uniref:A24 family peptidase n=1 Tax=Vibrio sp. 10N.261.51.F12 TaxID=3229679 RepID=UPI00354F55E7